MIVMIHIVFYAPYEKCVPVIEQVFAERPDRHELTHKTIVDSYNNRLLKVEADAVISRGFTAHTMEKRGIIGAELKISGYDVIIAVDQCLKKHHCRKIAAVGAFNMLYGVEAVACVYPDVEIRSYTATDETLLESSVERAVAEGAEAIVGGRSTVALAEQKGVPAVLIESGKEAVNSAISNAVQAVRIARRERHRSQEIASIMDYSFQGILSTNQNGDITLVNQYCRTMFQDAGRLIGNPLSDLFPTVPFSAVIQKKQKVLSEIHCAGAQQFMVNCVPIADGEMVNGCVLTFQEITKIQEEEEKIRKRMHHQGFTAKYTFRNILHQDQRMQETVRVASNYSRSDSNLLIHGETGTGKELFAQSIHNASHRRGKPFVALNCAALPEDLLESELFGYAEGAFTGASKGGKMGMFEIAHTGTIFLDEIGDISPKLQSRLLRVLQEREIIRLGQGAVIPIDVRVISATNRDLWEEVQSGRFRQDLLYRLDVLELHIPPLRERSQDIPFLIRFFIGKERQKTGCVLKGLSPEGFAAVLAYDWFGNVRELRNFCERLCVLSVSEMAGSEDVRRALPDYARLQEGGGKQRGLEKPKHGNTIEEMERQVVLDTLCRNRGNRGKTADELGIDKSTLWRKMKKHQITQELLQARMNGGTGND